MAGMVIIGAGECGARAALTLRENGYDGPVTLIGDEVHLPYERPPLSKEAMTGEDMPAPKSVADEARLAAHQITHIAGRTVSAVDPASRQLVLSDGQKLSYDKLLLATGAQPRRLPLTEALSRAVYLRTFDDALALRSKLTPGARVAIVGGGFIGLELAASATKRGAKVTVIEAQARILMRGVPAEIAAVIQGLHEAAGVEVICGLGIASVAEDEREIRFTLADGRIIAADVAVIGIGATPVTGLAQAAGLAIENGIVADSRLATSDPHIFAAGDCCSFPLALYGGRRVRLEAWRNAQDQGALAARNMLGGGNEHVAVPWFWSDQYDHSLQIAGLSDEGRRVVRRDLGEGAFILFHLAEDGRLVAASGVGPGNAVARDIRLAEMIIAKRGRPSEAQLASPEVKLKSLLAS